MLGVTSKTWQWNGLGLRFLAPLGRIHRGQKFSFESAQRRKHFVNEGSLAFRESLHSQNVWCLGPESNRYVPFGTQDFKSCASTNFATQALGEIKNG